MSFSENVDLFGLPQMNESLSASRALSVDEQHKRVDLFLIAEHERVEREKEMNAKKLLEEIEQRLEKLDSKRIQEVASKADDFDSEESEEEKIYSVVLSDESLERFADGLLTVLGELDQEKLIPEIENASQARSALLGVVRQLYQRKSVVAKMSRKFARFGAKQFLRRQRALIGQAID